METALNDGALHPATTTHHCGPTAVKHRIDEVKSQSFAQTPKLEPHSRRPSSVEVSSTALREQGSVASFSRPSDDGTARVECMDGVMCGTLRRRSDVASIHADSWELQTLCRLFGAWDVFPNLSKCVSIGDCAVGGHSSGPFRRLRW